MDMSNKTRLLTSVAMLAGGFLALGPAASAQEIVGLITKTNTNPFFVKMKEGAQAKARSGPSGRWGSGKVGRCARRASGRPSSWW
jgi:ABC-type sugar transport system substrate-binding protein